MMSLPAQNPFTQGENADQRGIGIHTMTAQHFTVTTKRQPTMCYREKHTCNQRWIDLIDSLI